MILGFMKSPQLGLFLLFFPILLNSCIGATQQILEATCCCVEIGSIVTALTQDSLATIVFQKFGRWGPADIGLRAPLDWGTIR